MVSKQEMRHLIGVLAALLEAPQNRFGKLDFYNDEETRKARMELLILAEHYDVDTSATVVEQAAKVARAILSRASK